MTERARNRYLGLRRLIAGTAVVTAGLSPAAASATEDGGPVTFGDVEVVQHIEFRGGTEVAFDGRYAYVGHASLRADLNREDSVMNLPPDAGGLRIVDLVGGEDPDTGAVVGQFDQVGVWECPGTDNYVRALEPAVFNPDEPDRQFVVVASHGNRCTRNLLLGDPNTAGQFGALNGIAVLDVTDRTTPTIVNVLGHNSAHTVMPHPTRPYLYVLPGGIANGTNAGQGRVSPTAIVDAADLADLRYVRAFTHNAMGCHDLGWTADGEWAYCAGLGEVQVWDVSGDNIEAPVVVNTIVNPAIQFAHNAVVSPDGRWLVVNDEAFGFHTCRDEAADLYGSLWIYDISIPDLPVLAGRISPPAHPDPDHLFGTLGDIPGVQEGWMQSWCAAHNYNFVPGTSIVVASWYAGGLTAHDIADPLTPELLVAYQHPDAVLWSAHYYGGYLITGDARRGTEILDAPRLREREAQAAAEAAARAGGGGLGVRGPGPDGLARAAGTPAPRRDLTGVLVPAVLPPRPATAEPGLRGGICAIPGI